MVFSRSSWRFLAVLAALCVLPLGLGCGGKKSNSSSESATTVTVSGTATYTRVPLLADADGIPTGLETDKTKFTSLPLRGAMVRAYQSTSETDANGNAVTVWKVVASTSTGTDGTYTLTVTKDESTFVEILSAITPSTGSGVRVLATSISDSTPVSDRPYYLLRKGVDGGSADQTPGSVISANATVDFAIDLDKAWWKGPLATTITKTVITGATPSTTWAPNVTLETVGTGSRVAAILDSAYTFGYYIGEPTPGAALYLHYLMNSGDAGPSFIEYDLAAHSATKSTNTYFGYIRGASANDDAFDEGVIFPLLARNHMVAQGYTTLRPTLALSDRSDLQDLRPEMALMEGFSQGIAAVLLKSPYLADTNGATISSLRDVRATGLGKDAYSAANIAALTWKLYLAANSVADTPTGWAGLTRTALNRFFTVSVPKDSTTSTYPKDVGSIYSQLIRLQEAQGTSDSVNLAAFFPDATLTTLVTPFGLTWPRLTTLPTPFVSSDAGYLADWGTNPNSLATALPSFTLGMGNAHANSLGLYPNFSKDEVFTSRFTLSGDRIYALNILTVPTLPSTAQVQVTIGGLKYLFDAGTEPIRLPYLDGDSTTAVYQSLQVRLLSPVTKQPSDFKVTLELNQLEP